MKSFNEYWNEIGESDLRELRLANRKSDTLREVDDAVNIRQAAQNAWDAALKYNNDEVNELTLEAFKRMREYIENDDSFSKEE